MVKRSRVRRAMAPGLGTDPDKPDIVYGTNEEIDNQNKSSNTNIDVKSIIDELDNPVPKESGKEKIKRIYDQAVEFKNEAKEASNKVGGIIDKKVDEIQDTATYKKAIDRANEIKKQAGAKVGEIKGQVSEKASEIKDILGRDNPTEDPDIKYIKKNRPDDGNDEAIRLKEMIENAKYDDRTPGSAKQKGIDEIYAKFDKNTRDVIKAGRKNAVLESQLSNESQFINKTLDDLNSGKIDEAKAKQLLNIPEYDITDALNKMRELKMQSESKTLEVVPVAAAPVAGSPVAGAPKPIPPIEEVRKILDDAISGKITSEEAQSKLNVAPDELDKLKEERLKSKTPQTFTDMIKDTLNEKYQEMITGKRAKAIRSTVGISEPTVNDDKAAILGGSKYTLKDIKIRELKLKSELDEGKEITDRLSKELFNTNDELTKLDVKIQENSRKISEIQSIAHQERRSLTELENAEIIRLTAENTKLYTSKREKDRKISELEGKRDLLKRKYVSTLKDIRTNEDRLALYNTAVVEGKAKLAATEGWRSELKSFSTNTESMLGKPTIGDPSKLVGYGGLTGKGVSKGFAELIPSVKVSDTANEWMKTKAGDRNLVESLVKVNQTLPLFGIDPRTRVVAQYVSPSFKQIGIEDLLSGNNTRSTKVGDVTASPRFRITPEDVRRKKLQKSKPNMMRPSGIKTISIPDNKKTNIKGISVNGNLPSFSMLNKSKGSSIKKMSVSGNIKLNVPKIPNFDLPNNTLKLSSVSNVEASKNNSKFNNILKLSPVSNIEISKNNLTKHNNIKLNVNSMKFNMDNIIPFTSKNIELNINTISNPIVKKKFLKVNK